QSLFHRTFKFKQLFFIRFFSALIPGFVSIPLALKGYGVWSLVFGALSGTAVQVLILWKVSPWRPKFGYDFSLAKQLFGFSSWVTLEALLGWIIVWGDSIILGHFLGVKELGVYRVGVTFITLLFGIFFNPLKPVAYSSFSRLQSNLIELKKSFLKSVKLITAISLPIGVGLIILSKPISSVIFGGKWKGIEIVIGLIGIMYAIAWLVGINPEVYRAIGRPDINSKLLIINVIYYIPVYLLAAPHGLFIFCIARLSVSIISLMFHFYFVRRILKISFIYLSKFILFPMLGSVTMGIFVYITYYFIGTFNGWQGWLKLTFIILTGCLCYLFTLKIFEKDLVKQFFNLAISIVK
ncbi:MAG: oligosaccharide flippase family protein, partial [Candidatus Hodarchaeota archaeon]